MAEINSILNTYTGALALLALCVLIGCVVYLAVNLNRQKKALEEANAELQDRIDNPGALENIMDLAREFLGLENPDTIIIDPN